MDVCFSPIRTNTSMRLSLDVDVILLCVVFVYNQACFDVAFISVVPGRVLLCHQGWHVRVGCRCHNHTMFVDAFNENVHELSSHSLVVRKFGTV